MGPLALGDKLTEVKQVMDDSLVEGEAVMEEPVMKVLPAGEEPAIEHPTLGCECPQDTQKDNQVHTPKDDPGD